MIPMTLNCWGLFSFAKKLEVKRLIEQQSLDLIYLQETMCDGDELVKDMELLLKGWLFISVDAKGKSGGLLLGWGTCKFLLMNA